uniref:Ras-associating domain-containing protein n=1 Tax=Strongyloides stercoralis TaxID=6248 RepID=A0A0K0EFQ8_STRER
MEITILMGKEEKIVSGITPETTCADIIYAMAHSSGQKGKFVLLAKFNEGEYKFLPNEKVSEVIKNKNFKNNLELRQLHQNLENSKSSNINNKITNNMISQNNHSSKVGNFNDNQKNIINHSFKQQLDTQKQLDTNLYDNKINKTNFNEYVDSRPPPPAYRDVINQKYRSLIGNNSTLEKKQYKQRHSHVNYDLGILNVQTDVNSPIALLTNINRSCNHILKEQQLLLQSLEIQFNSEEEKELYQLLKQKSNLDMMISKIKECNYEEKLKNCQKESIALQNEIKSVEMNIKKINDDIEQYKNLISRLENEISIFLEQEKNDYYNKNLSISSINRYESNKASVY